MMVTQLCALSDVHTALTNLSSKTMSPGPFLLGFAMDFGMVW